MKSAAALLSALIAAGCASSGTPDFTFRIWTSPWKCVYAVSRDGDLTLLGCPGKPVKPPYLIQEAACSV